MCICMFRLLDPEEAVAVYKLRDTIGTNGPGEKNELTRLLSSTLHRCCRSEAPLSPSSN